MRLATNSWSTTETDPQRASILRAADRLLAGTPRRSTGNLSVVQLAVEADVKYWVIAQKHTDLRDHFQRLATKAKDAPTESQKTISANESLQEELSELKRQCATLEARITLYATALNEISLENATLREELEAATKVTKITRRQR